MSWETWAASMVVMLFLVLALSTTNMRIHSHGGVQGQQMLMGAARHFAEEGFIANRLTPVVPLHDADWGSVPDGFYTHFTPLPFYAGGLIWRWFGADFLYFKLFNILLTALFVIGCYLLFARLFSPRFGVVAILALILHQFVYMQAIHSQLMLADVFKVFGLLALVVAIQTPRRRTPLMLLVWVLYFLNAYSSFEYIVSFQILATGLIFLLMTGARWRWTIFLGTAPVAAMALHFLNNAWALGGIEAAIADLTHAYEGRTVGNEVYHSSTMQEKGLKGFPLWLLHSLASNHGISWIGLAGFVGGFGLLALDAPARPVVRRYLIVLGLFILADTSFYILFPQLAMMDMNHAQLGRNWLTAYALLAGGAIYFLLFPCLARRRGIRPRIAIPVIVCGIAALTIPVVTARKAGNQLLRGKWSTWAEPVALLREAASFMPEGGTVLTTSVALAQAAFYHQPRESFGLPPFDMRVVHDASGLTGAASASGGPKYLLVPVRTAQPGRHEEIAAAVASSPKGFHLLRILGNTHATHELLPAGTAVSVVDEQASTGAYLSLYNAGLEVVGREERAEKGMPGEGRFALRVHAAQGARSGLTHAEDQFPLIAGQEYAATWTVHAEEGIDDLRFGIKIGDDLHFARHPITGADRQRVPAGRWTTLRAQFTSPVTTDSASAYLWCVQPGPLTWDVGAMTFGEAGGWALYRVDGGAFAGDLDFLDTMRNAAAGPGDSGQLAPLTALYQSTLDVVESAVTPGIRGDGDFSVRIASRGAERSGLSQNSGLFTLEPGGRYRFDCLIHTPDSGAEFRIGLQNEGAGTVWAADPVTGREVFRGEAGGWTPLRAEIEMPETTSGTTALWIVQWNRMELAWLIDGIKISRIE